MGNFESQWPDCFYNPISKKVTTMANKKKGTKVGDVIIYNTEVIFSRVMCLQSTGQLVNLQDFFKYELSPIPTSLFKENGKGRYP